MALAAIYLAGIVVGIVAIDGSPSTKVGLALAWPLGPAAFVLTISMLIVVAGIAFPVFGLALIAAIAATVWFLT